MALHINYSGQKLSWFKDRLAEDKLIFRPPFQRNPVWPDKHKSYLVDTVLRRLPIPEIYMQADTDERGKTIYSIVDGQQRVRALLEFARGEVALSDQYTPGRDGETWDDLTGAERKAFWSYELVVREIQNATEPELRDLFRRLNQNTVTLNAQEIRNARFRGDFITAVTELADNSFWAENRIVSANEIRRMVDIEFMAELLVGLMHGPQNKKQTLDAMFVAYEDGIPNRDKWLSRFERSRALIERLLPDVRATRWRGKSDFYSLFLAVSELAEERDLVPSKTASARRELEKFGENVSERLSKDSAKRVKTSKAVRDYAVAVEKAASDKDRREARHQILTKMLAPFFA